MKFSIDAAVLGTSQHLIIDDDGYSLSREKPNDRFHLSGVQTDDRLSMDALLALSMSSVNLVPEERFSLPFVSLGMDLSKVPWHKVMPSWAHRSFTESLINQLRGNYHSLPLEYFESTWYPEWDVVRSLKPAKIDLEALDCALQTAGENVSNLATFIPDDDGMVRPPVYNRFGTVTGRLTVKSGPGILTLKKEHRSMITPSRPGKIMMIDFKSLEARILLSESTSERLADDVYAKFATDFGIDRNVMKEIVLAKLYGSSSRALASRLSLDINEVNRLVSRIDSTFDTSRLLIRLREQRKMSEFILNKYGRPVKVEEPIDRILINYYAQSTGVDVALLGFSSIVKKFRERRLDVIPLYVLHDALIVDVGLSAVSAVESIEPVSVPSYEQPFPVKVETINCTPGVQC